MQSNHYACKLAYCVATYDVCMCVLYMCEYDSVGFHTIVINVMLHACGNEESLLWSSGS